MSDNEIKLTNTNNTTVDGTSFPQTPKPQVLNENFSSIEINTGDIIHSDNHIIIDNEDN